MLSFLHMTQHTFRVIIEPDGKRFRAYAPALPGCHTHGKTIAEAQRHIGEAIELYVEALGAEGEPIPQDASFETFHTVLIETKKSRARRAYA